MSEKKERKKKRGKKRENVRGKRERNGKSDEGSDRNGPKSEFLAVEAEGEMGASTSKSLCAKKGLRSRQEASRESAQRKDLLLLSKEVLLFVLSRKTNLRRLEMAREKKKRERDGS